VTGWQPDRACDSCGRRYAYEDRAWQCRCGGTLSIHEAGQHDSIALGEGGTPMLRLPQMSGDVWAKLEFLSPTSSFKDRGAATMVARLRRIGVREVADDSAGNAGVSIAAYCAAAGIGCRIFVARSANLERLAAIRCYGAEVTVVDAGREAAAQAALESGAYFAGHAWDPFFVEGLTGVAAEIAAQSGDDPAARVIFPLGQGTLLLGLVKGFGALVASGRLECAPDLVAVQTDACAPLHEAMLRGLDRLPAMTRPTQATADGIAVASPVRWRSLIALLRRGTARVVAAQDRAVPACVRALGRCGLAVEPTASVVLDALRQLEPAPGRTVLILTASALKTQGALQAIVGRAGANSCASGGARDLV